MAGWLHGVFVGEWLFVFPLCGFSLSLFCNCPATAHCRAGQIDLGSSKSYNANSAAAAVQFRVAAGSCGRSALASFVIFRNEVDKIK